MIKESVPEDVNMYSLTVMRNIKGFTTHAFRERNFIAIHTLRVLQNKNGSDLIKKNKLQLPLCVFHQQHGEVHHPASSIIIPPSCCLNHKKTALDKAVVWTRKRTMVISDIIKMQGLFYFFLGNEHRVHPRFKVALL